MKSKSTWCTDSNGEKTVDLGFELTKRGFSLPSPIIKNVPEFVDVLELKNPLKKSK